MLYIYSWFLFILFTFSLTLGLEIYQVISICLFGLLFSCAHYLLFAKSFSFPNVFVSVSLFLFCFTIPNLYFISDSWWLASVKDLDFTHVSILNISIRFLFCITSFFYICKLHSILYLKYLRAFLAPVFRPFLSSFTSILQKITRLISIPIILILFCFSISLLRLFAFSLSIAITGLDPTPLPFKLTGIIVFLLSLAPLLLSYLLLRTNNMLCISSIIVCSTLNSILGASKFQLFLPLLVLLAKLLINILTKEFRIIRVFKFLLLLSLTIFSLTFIDTIKSNLVFSNSVGNRSLESIDFAISSSVDNINESSIPFLVHSASSFLSRFDSIENIFIASTYDPYNVSDGQPLDRLVIPFARFLYDPSADDHHIEWIGSPYIAGFYLGGGFLSELFILFYSAPFFFFLFSNIVAFIFVLISSTISLLNLSRFNIICLSIIFSFVIIADIGGIWFYCCLILFPVLFQSFFSSPRRHVLN